jgi:hypothetical protein
MAVQLKDLDPPDKLDIRLLWKGDLAGWRRILPAAVADPFGIFATASP